MRKTTGPTYHERQEGDQSSDTEHDSRWFPRQQSQSSLVQYVDEWVLITAALLEQTEQESERQSLLSSVSPV